MIKNFKKITWILVIVLALMQLIKADVAPNPDELRMTADLIVETSEDLSDYRFFLDFSNAIHEVEIKRKSQNSISSPGGGARYGSGNLLAIPKQNLKDFPEKLTTPYQEPGKSFAEAITSKKIEGIIELGNHRFGGVIKISERKNWTYPTYRLERKENSLKLVKLNDISPKISDEEEKKMRSGGIDFSTHTISKGLTPLGYLILIGFPTAAIIILGIWLFRRKGRKLNQ